MRIYYIQLPTYEMVDTFLCPVLFATAFENYVDYLPNILNNDIVYRFYGCPF